MTNRVVNLHPTFSSRDFAIGYGEIWLTFDQPANYLAINPLDWYLMLLDPALNNLIDKETLVVAFPSRKLVNSGIAGYLWGATIVLDKRIPQGVALLSLLEREVLDEFISDVNRDLRANAVKNTVTMFVLNEKLQMLGTFTGSAEAQRSH